MVSKQALSDLLKPS